MEDLGYNSYYEVLNAKHYGIPQNRERVFTVSIRKDIDKKTFKFPEKEELKLKLKDVLEETVDEKFFINAEMTRKLQKDIEDKCPKCIQVGTLDMKGQDIIRRVYSDEGISPTLTNMQGGNRQPKVIIDDTQGFDGVRVYKEYAPALRASRPGLKTAVAMRGRYNPDGKVEQHLEISNREIANSITTVQKDSMVAEPYLRIKEATKLGYKDAYEGDGVNISGRMKYQRGNVQKEMTQTLVTSGNERGVVVPDETASLGLRIRKLTPREC